MSKLAVITGGSGGIAGAIAAQALAAGYRVALLDLARHEGGDPAIEHHVVDVTDEAGVASIFDKLEAVPDLLVNAAATIRFAPFLDQTPADFRRVIDVNVCGTLIPALLAARGMAARGSGVIVNLTSINAINPGPATGAYPCSKAAVAKLSEHMALEWGPLGIRVNALAPGFIDTGMSATTYADAQVRAERSAGVPVRRLGMAEDIASAVMFLASDAAAYIHGHHLVVDGGVSISLLTHLRREPQANNEGRTRP